MRDIPRLLCAALLYLVAIGAATAEVIVDAAYVAAARERGAIVWDTRADGDYLRGHIPGAVNIGEAAKELRDGNGAGFVSPASAEKLLGDAGIDPGREIIVYSRRAATDSYFVAEALRYFGVRGVKVFHDGLDGWSEAGRGLKKDAERRGALRVKLDPAAQVLVDTREVVAKVNAKADVQLLDTRSAAEFHGDAVYADRAGHIPGARNIPYEANWRDAAARDRSLKDSDALKAIYAGLDPNKETIVYCQSGSRAAETSAVLQHLGFSKVRLYVHSWRGYAAQSDAPAVP